MGLAYGRRVCIYCVLFSEWGCFSWCSICVAIGYSPVSVALTTLGRGFRLNISSRLSPLLFLFPCLSLSLVYEHTRETILEARILMNWFVRMHVYVRSIAHITHLNVICIYSHIIVNIIKKMFSFFFKSICLEFFLYLCFLSSILLFVILLFPYTYEPVWNMPAQRYSLLF